MRETPDATVYAFLFVYTADAAAMPSKRWVRGDRILHIVRPVSEMVWSAHVPHFVQPKVENWATDIINTYLKEPPGL